MPLKMGKSKEVVSQNIREMVRSGRPVKQAVAASLSMRRKSAKKGYAEGGEVMQDMDAGAMSDMDTEADRSLPEINAMGRFNENEIANPQSQDYEKMLAKALFDKAEKDEVMGYAMGGLVQPETEDEPIGNKPSMDMVSETGEPMSDEMGYDAELDHAVIDGVPENKMALGDDVMAALADRKKKRRYFS